MGFLGWRGCVAGLVEGGEVSVVRVLVVCCFVRCLAKEKRKFGDVVLRRCVGYFNPDLGAPCIVPSPASTTSPLRPQANSDL